jgi:hypothetical protein
LGLAGIHRRTDDGDRRWLVVAADIERWKPEALEIDALAAGVAKQAERRDVRWPACDALVPGARASRDAAARYKVAGSQRFGDDGFKLTRCIAIAVRNDDLVTHEHVPMPAIHELQVGVLAEGRHACKNEIACLRRA